MDIPRQPVRRKRYAPLLAAAACALAIVLVTLGLGRLRVAAPEVDRTGLWIGTVQRGEMIRQVKGPGSLVPEEVRWITAETAGRIERILVKPGVTVAADTLLLEITNPDVVLEELAAGRDVASSEVELLQARSRLQTQELAERASVAALVSELADVRRRAEAYRTGGGEIISTFEVRRLADREAELQAKDLQIGQAASIDTHNGMVAGRVARIAPAASQGTVTVEVTLEGPLPQGARPDLSIEGSIEIERLKDVLSVQRPAGAQPEAAYSLFKLNEGGEIALRERVDLGRTSIGTIEVRGGLREGDRVILSDMSRWDGTDRIKLR